MTAIKFLNTGALQTYTIPSGLTEIKIKVWGGAGGPNMGLLSYAGCGGYSEGLINVTAGLPLQIMVGSAGVINNSASSFGGGGGGGADAIAGPGAQGGGRSGVAFSTGTQFIIAGGGGAARGSGNSINVGGNGGGLIGNNEVITTAPGSVK